MNRQQIIEHLEQALKQLKEEEKPIVIPENEIMYTKDRFFIIPRRVRIESTGKTKWMIGSAKNCRSIKYYYRDYHSSGPGRPGSWEIEYDFYYEVD